MSPLLPMNASEKYQLPEPPPLLVTHTYRRLNVASTIIAALSLCAILLALAFLVGYGVYRFGTGFLLGKRVPRKCGGVIGNNGGISARVSGVHGSGGGGKGREGKGKGRSGELETVIEAPEEEGEGEERRQGGLERDRAKGESVDAETGR